MKKGFGIFHFASSLEKNVVVLRKKLIKEGLQYNSDIPPAGDLFSHIEHGDIAICFPDYARSHFYYARFYLDLNTHKPFALLEDERFSVVCPVTPEEFHTIAVKYRFWDVLQCFQTANDWEMIFDEEMEKAKEQLIAETERMAKENEAELNQKYGIDVSKYCDQAPLMNVNKAYIEISKENNFKIFCSLEQKKGHYILSVKSLFSEKDSRTLSESEACWAEEKIKETLDAESIKQIQSSADLGRVMTVFITVDNKECESFSSGTPIQKYADLQSAFEDLIHFGPKQQ